MRSSSLLVLALLSACKKSEAPAPASGSEVAAQPASAPADAAPPPPPPVDAVAADAAPPATDPDPLKSICPKVIAKIQECSADKEFAGALLDGANAKDQKKIRKLIAEIAEWPINYCNNLAANYQFEGLLNHWDQLADPAILESCGKLGTAVKAAGGLFGGDQAM
jgi:hypothetical protein